MEPDLKSALDAVPARHRDNVSWGSRSGDFKWAARVGPCREFGHVSAAAAIRAATARLPKTDDCPAHPGTSTEVCPCRDFDGWA